MNLASNNAFLLSVLISFLVPCHAWAQGSLEDYDRADELRKRFSGKVFRDNIKPRWIGDARFWYEVKTGKEASEFLMVDAEAGTRKVAFDREGLASALTKAAGEPIAADKLPLRDLEFVNEGAELKFVVGRRGFRYDVTSGELSRIEREALENGTTVTVLGAARAARFNGESTEISFLNETDAEIEFFWVGDPDAPTSYGKVKPGEEIAQHTYAGHVWLVTAPGSEVPLGVFEATATPGLAVIDGSWKLGKVEKKRDRRPRRDRRPLSGLSPDGMWRVKFERHNVRLIEVSSDAVFELTVSGTAEDPFQGPVHWSPDGKKLVVMQRRIAEKRVVHTVESSPKEQLQPELKSFDYVKPGDVLDHPRPHLFDVATRAQISISEDLFPEPWRLSEFHWEADSSRFTFLYNQRGHQVLSVVAVDAETGRASTLIEEVPETFVCYSSKTFYRRLEETNEIVWMSERDGWNHLYLFDSETGALKNQVTQGEWVVRKVDRVDSEKREIWFQAGGLHPDQDPYQVHYARVRFDGTELVCLTEGDGTHRVEYSPNGRYLIDTYSRVDLPPVRELRRVQDGSLVMALEEADVSALREAGWQAPERFVATGRDGETPIYGIIHKPSNFDPNKRYPVIEKIYAGPHAAHVPKSFSTGGSQIAELGFIVVQIDGMGTSHRSKAFHDVCCQNIGDAGFPDRVRWIKAAAESRPWMDLSRVGIYGGSAGGQNAMRALIAHHDFYHVAVADCGCHDNRMDKIWWNEQWMGYPIGEHYAASSNVDQAHRMEGKLMLIVGELDTNVDPASTMQVVDALIKADKDFDLVVIPGAGHGAAGTAYGRRRQRDFFVRHLLGVEPRH